MRKTLVVEIFLAILAVVGTLLGALLAFRAPAWNQERIDKRREVRDLRVARRLVAGELNLLVASLRAVADSEAAPSVDLARLLPMNMWEVHRAVLAGADAISIVDWRRLDVVYTRVAVFRQRVPGPLNADDLDVFRDTASKAEYGRNLLVEEEFQAAGLNPAKAKIEWPDGASERG